MLTIPEHLTQIATYLCALLARFLPLEHRPAAEGPSLYVVLANRVGRYAHRIARLHALFLAGRLPPPRPSRTALQPAPAPAPRRPSPVVPRARFWLLKLGRHEIATARSRLELWLQRPELPEFLAAAPQAGRHLRPLCRLLTIAPPAFLALPPRPRRIRSSRPRRTTAAAPDRPTLRLPPGDRPLPPYVLAFARAMRKNPR